MAGLPSSELDKPLGRRPPAKPASLWPRRVGYGLAALPVGILATAAAYVAVMGDPKAARPSAVAVITEPPKPGPAPGGGQFTFSAQDAALPPPPERAEATAGQLEQDSGVKVVRPGAPDTLNSVVIRVPDAGQPKLAPAPDRRLVERTRQGVLPRIGEDGARPSQVYARPAPRDGAASQPRIAILVGGLGISAAATAEAIAKLPPDISLAFAPYGGELERQVQRARADGHEVFLQVPMEPFDYPDNDPGPHTLTAGQASADNLERLRWVMSRFPGYVGIVNFMGARLMSDEAALGPVLREVAERGLMVVDDGSSGRSLMLPVASGFRAPALKADLVVDLAARPDAIDRELARLEQQAREKGFAFGSASALPLTLDRLSRWSRTLEQRGIRLVPVSAGGAARAQTTGSVR